MVFERIAAEQRSQGDDLHHGAEQRHDQDGKDQREPRSCPVVASTMTPM